MSVFVDFIRSFIKEYRQLGFLIDGSALSPLEGRSGNISRLLPRFNPFDSKLIHVGDEVVWNPIEKGKVNIDIPNGHFVQCLSRRLSKNKDRPPFFKFFAGFLLYGLRYQSINVRSCWMLMNKCIDFMYSTLFMHKKGQLRSTYNDYNIQIFIMFIRAVKVKCVGIAPLQL